MIVVVASTYDVRAQRIVAHWGSHGATMLTAEDLCMPGWSLTVPKLIEPTAVIGGRTVPAAEIRGILTLRPCIFPEELQGFHSSDRKYVAAELNAFLLAWLSAQSCPVLNRPTACSLAGPNWRAEQWAHAAAGLGIPARSRRSLPNRDGVAHSEPSLNVIAVGEHCFGCDGSVLSDWTRQLARAAGVDLLSASYSIDRSRFLAANIWPSLSDPAVLAAVREML